jgi:hypothetical protein
MYLVWGVHLESTHEGMTSQGQHMQRQFHLPFLPCFYVPLGMGRDVAGGACQAGVLTGC